MSISNKRLAVSLFAAAFILAIAITPSMVYAYRVTKEVSPLEDGNFMIKIRLNAGNEGIYCLKLIDPEESVLNVYAPDGWCIATDGGTVVARSNLNPAKGKTVEFIIYSNLEDVSFTCSAFGRIDQIGKPVNI